MAQSEPNPNVDPTITGQEAWFNEDARFYKDVYVYGNLYYDFEGTDALNLDELNVSGIATFKDVDITGSLDVEDLTLKFSYCPSYSSRSRCRATGLRSPSIFTPNISSNCDLRDRGSN